MPWRGKENMNKKIIIPAIIVVVATGAVAYATLSNKNQCDKNTITSPIHGIQTMSERVQNTEGIVIGTITDIKPTACRKDKTGDYHMYTDYTLSIEQGIKGSIDHDVNLRLPGGSMGSGINKISEMVEDTPELVKGEKLLAFLSKNSSIDLPNNSYSIYGGDLGSYQIKDGQAINFEGSVALGELINQIQAPMQLVKPTAEKMETEKASIRKFMGDPNLDLIYRTTDKNATNLTVGKVTKLNSGGWQMDTPKEWERPVDIYQQTAYMDNRCEIYEYELDSRNAQVVEVRIMYPQELQGQDLMAAEIGTKCGSLPSLETPLKTKDQIEQEAFKYLGRDNGDILIKSNIQFVYTPSMKNPKNAPAFNEWKWQDKSYKLPEGLTADVEPYPTVRIIMSSNGRLVNYFNSRGLFN